jgi:hypothetical protein
MNTDFDIFLTFIRYFYYLVYNPKTSVIAISDNKNPTDNSDIIEIADIRGVRVIFVWDSGRTFTDYNLYHSENYHRVHDWITDKFKSKGALDFYEDCIITDVPFQLLLTECEKIFGEI